MNSTEPEHEARTTREASDDVISRSQRDVCVVRVGLLHQQQFGVFVGFLKALQCLDMLLLENHEGVRLHSCRHGEREESLRVARVFCETSAGKFSGLLDGSLKT